MERYKSKYRSDSTRIKNWDYGSPGYYYVTVCTKNHNQNFGEVVLWDGPVDAYNYMVETRAWDGKCGGIAGTHNYASLPPPARPAHVSPAPSSHTHAVVILTPIGKIAFQNWLDIPKHFPFVSLDEFVIMPDHIHGILCFKKPGYRERHLNSFGPQSQNLGSVLRNYKSATKAYATSHEIEFAWQSRFMMT
ncbi:MAG: hypothetical protein WD824_11305 [Cyclobacteriaceae bacterium]